MKGIATQLRSSAAALVLGALLGGVSAPAGAQELDVFYDEYGRRIILDAYTGELIRIDPPRRPRDAQRRIYLDEDGYIIEEYVPGQGFARRVPPRGADRRMPSERFPGVPIIRAPDEPPAARPRREREAPVERAPVEEPQQAAVPERVPLPTRRPALEPEIVEPEVAEPQIPEDDVPEAEIAERQIPEPEVVEPSIAEPEIAAPQIPELDVPEPRIAEPGPVEPSTGEREPLVGPEQTASAPALARPEPTTALETTASQMELAAVQVLLDRAGASPGVIDGRMGENLVNAVEAYNEITGQELDFEDAAAVSVLLEETGGSALTTYTITGADMDGPYIPVVPVDYSEKAELEHLSYTSVAEKLAERFHMSEEFLKSLNPGVDFSRPGTEITVANVGRNVDREVSRIVADKTLEQVFAYDASGELVAAYPATIGSTETPSPTGTHTVERVAFDPEYTYNPKINFQQGDNDEILTIPPGPNGPVGSVWIALSEPTYGIHGTPDPSTIGKTNSNGCVRLTNWDAQELAELVNEGVVVEFVE